MGQPLISDAAMRGMYTGVRQLQSAMKAPGFAADLPPVQRSLLLKQPAAMLEALMSQLHRRDTVLVAGDARLLQIAAETWFPHGNGPASRAVQSSDEECAAIAVGMALRITDWARPAASPMPVGQGVPSPAVIALLNGFPHLPALFKIVQDCDLSLLLFVRGDAEPRPKAEQRLHSTSIPVLQVDCTDAVAMCRVVQECLLRARNGWGGAVIHAAALPGSGDALALLEQHLAKRGFATS